MAKLGVLCTHPVQYHAPLFKKLAQTMDLEVYYARKLNARAQGAGFNAEFQWDVPLLEGYQHQFLADRSRSELGSAVRRRRFDLFIVFGWNYKASRQALWLCRKYRVPVYARGDSQLRSRPAWFQLAKRPLFERFLGLFDGFLSPGKRFSGYLGYFGVPEEKITFCPYGIDTERFRSKCCQSSGEREEFRTSLGIKKDAAVFLFCGKFEPKKRIFDFLSAIKELRKEDGNITGLLVGNGVLHRLLPDFSKRRRLNTVFTGFVNQREIPRYFSISDCLVLPSDGRETWGIVVNEAFACGVPAIVSDSVGCSPDLIQEPGTGYIFKTGQISDLVEKMRRFLSDKKRGIDFRTPIMEKNRKYSMAAAVESIRRLCNNSC